MSATEEKKSYWFKHYKSFIKSGLTQREYCRQREIGYWTFNQWKRRFDKSESETNFQQLPINISPKATLYSPIEIILNNKIRLSVPDNFSSETLKQVIQTLGDSIEN